MKSFAKIVMLLTGCALWLQAEEPPKVLQEVTNEKGDKLTLVSLSVPPGQSLKGGDEVTATIRYKAVSAKKVLVWAIGGSSYDPSQPLPPEGEITRSFGSNRPTQSKEIVVEMNELDETGENLVRPPLKLKIPANYQWTSYAPGQDPVAPVGKPFPELKFKSTDGREIDVAQLKGKVVLLDFWATWCGPCRQAMPEVKEVYKTYKEHGFEVIGISLDQDLAAMNGYTQKEGLPWPQYFDGKGGQNEVAKRFHVRSIPRVLILDRAGVVRHDSMDNHGDLLEAVKKLCADK